MYSGNWFLISTINFVIGIIEFLLSLRILLRFLGASSAAPFVSWLYLTTQPLLRPFVGMFPNPVLEGQFVLEFSTIFAFLFYAFLGFLLTELITFLTFSTRK